MKRAGTRNPVLLLDEIDKLGADYRGDPAAALLEVLDPEQHHAFNDHYLEVDFDLSEVMFITTANNLYTIPPALLDRMEVIRLPGYLEHEKVEIARRFLLPKQMKANGLKADDLQVTADGIRRIIRDYTRESGVRNLEREIATLCRKAARRKAAEKAEIGTEADIAGETPVAAVAAAAAVMTPAEKARARAAARAAAKAAAKAVAAEGAAATAEPTATPAAPATQPEAPALRTLRVTPANLHRFLGVPRFVTSDIERENRTGIATGLAWTEVGGEVLTVEVTVVPGKGELKLTGKLGEVMRESAQAALSYARARAQVLGIDRNFYKEIDLHVHLPEGAIPKDGPSAGITIAVALISALTGIPTAADLAMTGEITLRGRVLPVGGLAEKIVAARRHGLLRILVPKANEKDLVEIHKEARRGLEIVPVSTMDEVLELALVNPVFKAADETAAAVAVPVVEPAPVEKPKAVPPGDVYAH
jgi:ATP-dependent Lon protease